MSIIKANWLCFTAVLSKKAVEAIEPLTDEDHVNVFVVDDSLFVRFSVKKTELGSKVFDHTTMKYLDDMGWWIGDTSGWYARNGINRIDGVDYRFNASGYWVG